MKEKKMSALQYIRQQIPFSVKEWKELSDRDKEELKMWAVEEMDALGIEHV